jgi:integrase/recombinase XerD
LEELQRRNYSAITTRNYLRVVADFAKYFGKSPDKLGPNELRTYQAYLLQERKLTPGTVVNWVAALRFSLEAASLSPFCSSDRRSNVLRR